MGIGPPKPGVPAPAPATGATDAAEAAAAASAVAAGKPPSLVAHPAWEMGTSMSMLLFPNTAGEFSPSTVDFEDPLVRWDNLTLGNWKDMREEDLILDVPEIVRADNGSWWMDILLVKDGGSALGRGPNDVAHHRKGMSSAGMGLQEVADGRNDPLDAEEACAQGGLPPRSQERD